MLPFTKIPRRLLMEIIYAIIPLMNAITRKGGGHPTMSPGEIVTGKKLIIPPFVPGTYVYGVPGGSLNVTDRPRSFEALYLRPNDGGGGHFVYNIITKQRNSVPRVVGEEGKGIPMTDAIIRTINDQGSYENQPDGIVFGDMNNLTTILDLEPCADGEEDPEFDDDNASDRSYLSKNDDSTLSGDHDLPMHHVDDNPDGYHDDPGVGAEEGKDQGVGGEDVNDVEEEEDPLLEELHVAEDVVEEGETVEEYIVEEIEETEEEQEQITPEPEAKPLAKKPDDGLDGK
jgi:hypothetical protein